MIRLIPILVNLNVHEIVLLLQFVFHLKDLQFLEQVLRCEALRFNVEYIVWYLVVYDSEFGFRVNFKSISKLHHVLWKVVYTHDSI